MARSFRLSQCRQTSTGCGIEDRVGVDAIGAVEVGDVAGLTKAVDPERDDRVAGDGTEPRQGRRVEVADGDQRRTRPQPRQQPLGDPGFARCARRPPIAVQPVGRGDCQKPGFRDVFGHRLMRSERLGCDGTAIGDREFGTRPRLMQPIGAGDDRLGEARVDRSLGLIDRSRQQPEIDRFAGFTLDLLEGPAQQDRQLVGIGRLKARETGLGEPGQRLADRLVRAAFGGQGDPGRGRHQDKPRNPGSRHSSVHPARA